MNFLSKFYICSDLHLEFSNFLPPLAADQADIIILSGDIWKGGKGIHWARATWPDKHIIYVAGNHEFYGKRRGDAMAALRIAAKETGVHFLENEEVIIDGVRFLGSTLWTDFKLFGEQNKLKAMRAAMTGLSDFRVIHEGDKVFSPSDSVVLHEASVAWLDKKLHEPFDGPTVVVTHHLPSPQLVAEKYKDDILSACFASDVEHLMGLSELWIAGHTHTSFDLDIKGTRVVVNPRGYSTYAKNVENGSFKPDLVIKVGKGYTETISGTPLIPDIFDPEDAIAVLKAIPYCDEDGNIDPEGKYVSSAHVPPELSATLYSMIGKVTRVGRNVFRTDFDDARFRLIDKIRNDVDSRNKRTGPK